MSVWGWFLLFAAGCCVFAGFVALLFHLQKLKYGADE